MAATPLQTPPVERTGAPPHSPLKGDDAVPHGLAVASAITLRALIVGAGSSSWRSAPRG